MSEMFKNYPQSEDYIPNNRPRKHECPKIEIMTGETAVHTFEIPFDVEADCSDFEVIYKLGLEDIIIRDKNDLDTTVMEDDTSIITCSLSPFETEMFKDTLLRASVQIKFYMNTGAIAFSEIYRVYIVNSLEDNSHPVPPVPGVIGNIGYTED